LKPQEERRDDPLQIVCHFGLAFGWNISLGGAAIGAENPAFVPACFSPVMARERLGSGMLRRLDQKYRIGVRFAAPQQERQQSSGVSFGHGGPQRPAMQTIAGRGSSQSSAQIHAECHQAERRDKSEKAENADRLERVGVG
jgi:hypothetical protein